MATASLTPDLPLSSRRWFLAGVAGVVLVAACFYSLKAAGNASAIIRWQPLVQSVVRGENVYNEWTKDGSFPYPPFAALVLWPLTQLPPLAAGLTWFCLKVLMAGAAFHWSIQLATGRGERFSRWQVAALLLLASRPILSDLQHGNINILILFLVTAGLVAFRDGRDGLAGTMIALAAAIKLTPLLFIPYFAVKRQWRLVAWSVAALVVFMLAVPGPIIGWERNWWLIRSWSGAMVEPYVLEGKVETLQTNQSLPGVWMRLVTDSPGIELDDGTQLRVNCLALDPRSAQWALKAIILAIVAWSAWLVRGPLTDRGDRRVACEFALVFLVMLLISERSWKHHFVTLVLPFAVLLAELGRGSSTAAMRRYVWGSTVVAFFLIASTSSELTGWLMDGRGHKYAQGYGMFGASALILMAAILLLLRASPRTSSSPGE